MVVEKVADSNNIRIISYGFYLGRNMNTGKLS